MGALLFINRMCLPVRNPKEKLLHHLQTNRAGHFYFLAGWR